MARDNLANKLREGRMFGQIKGGLSPSFISTTLRQWMLAQDFALTKGRYATIIDPIH
jgi:hypothetical protein